MDPFEYLSVLVSIILGLGITQLLAGFGRWLEHRGTYRLYGPAIAWAAALMLVHVQMWWSMFGMRYWGEDWNFLQFSAVLLQPAILYLLTILAFPGPASTELDLRSNFFAQRRWFFGLFLAMLVVSVIKDLVRNGSLPEPANLAFHAVFFVMGAVALGSERDRDHRVIAYGGLFMLLVYIVSLFGRLET